MRKWWLIGGTLAAALALAGILGGALLAGGARTETKDDVYARAAAKLGVDAQALEDALTEAWDEVRAERKADAEQRLRDKLDALVEDGQLTREQADKWLDWLLARPDGDFGKKRWSASKFDKDWDCEMEIEKDDRVLGVFCGNGRFDKGEMWNKRSFHFGAKP